MIKIMQKVKVLVTGAKGFVGKNLVATLKTSDKYEVLEFDIDTDKKLLDKYVKECSFVCHLAGVNRPQNATEFYEGNSSFTAELIESLKKAKSNAPMLISSSTQATLDNDYGKSKLQAEQAVRDYGKAVKTQTYVFRLPNVFGKWARPNYNSAVATFCHNIANDLDIVVNNRDTELALVYVDDVVKAFISCIEGTLKLDGEFASVVPVHNQTLGSIVDLLYSFKEFRQNNFVASQTANSFSKKLYATYTSYLPTDAFSYPLKMNVDNRGSFTEFLKTNDYGQVSINVSKPGITKGNHWHHTKNEKFLVVSGSGIIAFKRIDDSKIIEYHVSGDKLEVVDIPTGFTHNIKNTGNTDLVTVMWANEILDTNNPDTYFLDVGN